MKPQTKSVSSKKEKQTTCIRVMSIVGRVCRVWHFVAIKGMGACLHVRQAKRFNKHFISVGLPIGLRANNTIPLYGRANEPAKIPSDTSN